LKIIQRIIDTALAQHALDTSRTLSALP